MRVAKLNTFSMIGVSPSFNGMGSSFIGMSWKYLEVVHRKGIPYGKGDHGE